MRGRRTLGRRHKDIEWVIAAEGAQPCRAAASPIRQTVKFPAVLLGQPFDNQVMADTVVVSHGGCDQHVIDLVPPTSSCQ
jgi:hypothetical protein